ncbi:MAG: response regulator [Lachnospiraceae bacterium]|nr:response regulator [Lachnospiraceae bacterium]
MKKPSGNTNLNLEAQANSMITALSSDYRSIYYINLDTDEGICYRSHSKIEGGLAQGEQFSFSRIFQEYANKYVAEAYRAGFLDFIKPENIREALETDAIIAYRYLINRGGSESWEMLRMAGVRRPEDRDDHIVHAVGVGFSDVDKEMRDTIAQRQALADALAVAEEASRAKTAFLSSMSHEIRTPMNAIIGLDSIALNAPDLSAETKEYLEKIGASAQHLLSIINDILDMSRIESGRMAIKNEEFAFAKLLEQVNIIIGGQCRDKGIEYVTCIDGHIDGYYIGDDMKLKQVLINILGNSVKFTEKGKVTFKVDRIAQYEGKSTMRFIMSDTGIGMSEEYLPKIFDSFSQEDSSATNKYGSTGLGMAITKNIVDIMNGNIKVESEKGKGTTFTVTVTLTDSDRKDGGEEHGIPRPQDMTVLIVDDDPVDLEHARLVLDQVGIVSETASSGREAIEKVRLRHARREPYQLILVDWKMPEMDGAETAQQIREVIGEDSSAIVILTAYNWEDVVEEAFGAGIDSFISKPLFAANVIDEFRQAITKRSENTAEKPKADLKGRKVILAEDIDINAEIMMMILATREVQADRAENGKIAVELFSSHHEGYYDAILMDMRMPEMDGLEATTAIRALDRQDAKKIPIIALTANAFDEDVQRSLQAGLNAHLSKPVEPETLYSTLESLIED